MLTILLILFVVGGLVMFIHKVIMKNAMEKKLGRKVQDREPHQHFVVDGG
jgi:hypothetical protein